MDNISQKSHGHVWKQTETRFKTERQWPKIVRNLFSRLRTGHALELRSYQNRFDPSKDPRCAECQQDVETIEHVLCICPAEAARRHQLRSDGKFSSKVLVSKPEICHQLLERQFQQLKPDEG